MTNVRSTDWFRDVDASVRKRTFTQRSTTEETGLTDELPERRPNESRTYWNSRVLTHAILGVHYRTPQFNLELLTQHLGSQAPEKYRPRSWSFVAAGDANLRFETDSGRVTVDAKSEIDPHTFLGRFGLKYKGVKRTVRAADSKVRTLSGKKRPELEVMAQHNWGSSSVLDSIAFELSFRQKKQSVELRNKILRRLQDLSKRPAVQINLPFRKEDVDEEEKAELEIGMEAEGEVEKTLLEYLGYTVSNRESASARRKILDAIYSQELPGPNARGWGAPKSATRRLHIAEILSSRCRRTKRNSRLFSKRQIEAWKADLKYFHERYF